MGHSLIKEHLHRIIMIDNPTCDFGTDHETPEHTIFHWQKPKTMLFIETYSW